MTCWDFLLKHWGSSEMLKVLLHLSTALHRACRHFPQPGRNNTNTDQLHSFPQNPNHGLSVQKTTCLCCRQSSAYQQWIAMAVTEKELQQAQASGTYLKYLQLTWRWLSIPGRRSKDWSPRKRGIHAIFSSREVTRSVPKIHNKILSAKSVWFLP